MYTYENWKLFTKEYGLSNKDVAEIIGKTLQNVNQQISPNKPLPTWARAMLFVHARSGVTFTVQGNVGPELGNALGEMVNKALINDLEPMPAVMPLADCGCRMDGNFFKRAKGCKIPRDNHKF